MHRGLVALSASAIAAIYMAGYLRTQAADASIAAASVPTFAAAATPVVAAAPPPPAATSTVQPIVQRAAPPATAPRAQPTPAPQAAAPPPQTQSRSQPTTQTQTQPQGQTQGQYKDGTFTGQGSSRRGDVWVSVEVQSGHIANVTITRSTLQYPLRDIAGLPAQVVQRQSAQVDIVSRATYSSQAFKQAVSQALSKAA